jgi:hypothetical protein
MVCSGLHGLSGLRRGRKALEKAGFFQPSIFKMTVLFNHAIILFHPHPTFDFSIAHLASPPQINWESLRRVHLCEVSRKQGVRGTFSIAWPENHPSG